MLTKEFVSAIPIVKLFDYSMAAHIKAPASLSPVSRIKCDSRKHPLAPALKASQTAVTRHNRSAYKEVLLFELTAAKISQYF